LNDEQKVNWKNDVAPLVHAHRATRHESTNYSPHFLMFGWHHRLGIDVFLGVDIEAILHNSLITVDSKFLP
jgi:hypothetical protein